LPACVWMTSDRFYSADLALFAGVTEPIAKPMTSRTGRLSLQNKLVRRPMHGSMAVKSSVMKG
ncbi:MAG: hypothetical protein VX862_04210, partial [Pseudomonadota bacterium]|nr:hypothetical protein [Pseudomonadota bacterium]